MQRGAWSVFVVEKYRFGQFFRISAATTASRRPFISSMSAHKAPHNCVQALARSLEGLHESIWPASTSLSEFGSVVTIFVFPPESPRISCLSSAVSVDHRELPYLCVYTCANTAAPLIVGATRCLVGLCSRKVLDRSVFSYFCCYDGFAAPIHQPYVGARSISRVCASIGKIVGGFA